MGSSVMLNCNGNTLQWHCIVPYFICMALYTFKYTIMVTLYHNMFSHNIVYDYGIIGILPLSHFNRQDKLRSREVKPDAGSHIAGRWPRWDSYPDVPDSRFRGCSPSQTERGCTKQGFHVFGRMQPGGCLWVGSSLVGPHTKRPHRQRQCIRASLSVQRTLGQRGHTPSGWGKCQETYLKDSCLQALLPRPLHFTTSQVSRSFTLAAVPFNNLIWHQESPDNFLLSSQTPPPTWPQRMASGTKRHPPEKAPLGSPGELAGMKDISEASQGQVGTTEGATSPGYVSFVLQATSLHCQQKSKGENSTWFYRLLRTKLPWGEFSVVDGVLRP